LIDVAAATYRELFSYENGKATGLTDFVNPASNSYPNTFITVFSSTDGFSPDGSGKMLFTGKNAAQVVNPDGSTVCRIDTTFLTSTGEPLPNMQYAVWNADGTGINWHKEAFDNGWTILLDDPTVAIPCDVETDAPSDTPKEPDMTISPSGLWKLEEVSTDGPIDIALRAANAAAGTGINLTEGESQQ
jgi:hypothetical protein